MKGGFGVVLRLGSAARSGGGGAHPEFNRVRMYIYI